MIDWAMHAKQSGRGDPIALPVAADNVSTRGIINGYEPGVKDVAPKVAITSSKVLSE